MNNILTALVMLSLPMQISFSQDGSQHILDVRHFGAKGDGNALDTKAIQRAVDSCGVSGGIVVFPPGRYLTGSIELRSNVAIEIQRGATIFGSPSIADYFERVPALKSYNNSFQRHSLLYAERQKNISIFGDGTINGQGSNFKVLTKERPARYMNRPYVIRFVECTNVSIRDITMESSGSWMQHYLACDGLMLRGLKVMNHANLNNDMMDIDGCRNVVISDCTGDTDDDAITLKSTSERVTQNVTITNCILSSHCNGIKAGTESTGGFRNITVNNVIIRPSVEKNVRSGEPGGISGISLEVVDGGTMEEVAISNVVIDGPDVPIFVRLGNRGRKHWEGAEKPGIGSMRNISLNHIEAHNVKWTGCSITGLPDHQIDGITLSDIRISYPGGVESMPDVAPAELPEQYPEATMWGTLPSYGLFVRHVRNLHVRGLEMSTSTADMRPAMVFADVVESSILDSHFQMSAANMSAIVLNGVNGLTMSGSGLRGTAQSLLKLVGEGCSAIVVTGNALRAASQVCDPPAALGSVVRASNNDMKR
ncbi:MAG TPA: glycosyl hydrolase family 28-related protein [Bacteroidota bacterium]|nr:glycosyl hydrolase family 28-related protein [Bacteroidota bacterium]